MQVILVKGGYVYIVSNRNRTVLYTGVSANLRARSHEQKQGIGSNFTKKYNCTDLVYYEFYESIEEAIKREKQLKKWRRSWKEDLIIKINPEMKDLYDQAENLDLIQIRIEYHISTSSFRASGGETRNLIPAPQ